MKNSLWLTLVALFGLVFAAPLCAQVSNGGFETGDFAGWIADPNWVIAKDSRGYYAGWQGTAGPGAAARERPPRESCDRNPSGSIRMPCI